MVWSQFLVVMYSCTVGLQNKHSRLKCSLWENVVPISCSLKVSNAHGTCTGSSVQCPDSIQLFFCQLSCKSKIDIISPWLHTTILALANTKAALPLKKGCMTIGAVLVAASIKELQGNVVSGHSFSSCLRRIDREYSRIGGDSVRHNSFKTHFWREGLYIMSIATPS